MKGHLGCVQEAAGEDIRLVRVMPNTPCLVGETASAMCLGGTASEEGRRGGPYALQLCRPHRTGGRPP